MSPTPLRCVECAWQSQPGMDALTIAAHWYCHWLDVHGTPAPVVDESSDLVKIHGTFHDHEHGGEA